MYYAMDDLNVKDKWGDTALMAACKKDPELTEELIKNPFVDPNLKDNWKRTPVMIAAKNNPELAQKMAQDSRFNLSEKDIHGYTAADYVKQFHPENPEIAAEIQNKANKERKNEMEGEKVDIIGSVKKVVEAIQKKKKSKNC